MGPMRGGNPSDHGTSGYKYGGDRLYATPQQGAGPNKRGSEGALSVFRKDLCPGSQTR